MFKQTSHFSLLQSLLWKQQNTILKQFTLVTKRAITSSNVPYTIQSIEQNKILLVTMQANKGNYFNQNSLQIWQNCLDEILDPNSKNFYNNRPVIITAPKSSTIFCAGMDLKETPKAKSPEEISSLFRAFEDVMYRIVTLPTRTVAMINGHVVAGGFFLALACDVRVAVNKNQQIGLNTIDVELTFPLCPYLMMKYKMRNEMCDFLLPLANQMYSPAEALKIGYLHHVCDDYDSLVKKSIEECLRIHPDSMTAYKSTKAYIFSDFKQDFNEKSRKAVTDEFIKVKNSKDSIRRIHAIAAKVTEKIKQEKVS